MIDFLPFIGPLIGGGSAIFAGFQAKKQQKELEKGFEFTEQAINRREDAARVRQRLERLKLARQRRDISRQARLARGQTLQGAASAGVNIGSSAVQGGIGGAQSVAAASQGFLTATEEGTQQVSDLLGQAAQAETQARFRAVKAGQAGALFGLGIEGLRAAPQIQGLVENIAEIF